MAKKKKVVWSKTAYRDLAAIIEYIALDSPASAKNVLYKIKDKALQLDHEPLRGRVVPELEAHGVVQYRELIIDSWRLMYRVASDTVYVLSVLDWRRNVEDVLLNRLLR